MPPQTLHHAALAIVLATLVAASFGVLAHGHPSNGDLSGLDTGDDRYILWYRNYDSRSVRALLELALEKTPEYGGYTIVRSQEMAQGRALRELRNPNSDLVDIANVAASIEREEQLYAVPVPIHGGLLGLRVCVVRKQNLPMFENVSSLDDFREQEIVIGQGAHWPDTPILEAAGIPVVTHSRFEVMFRMLRNDRFHCFARGVSEVLYDLESQPADDLVVEPNLMLAYPMPSYFFTGPRDHETAQRIQLGLDRAIRDGSFSDYLEHWFSRSVEILELDRRKVLELENPYLSDESAQIGREALESLRRRIGR